MVKNIESKMKFAFIASIVSSLVSSFVVVVVLFFLFNR
jgi:hypothetical protein